MPTDNATPKRLNRLEVQISDSRLDHESRVSRHAHPFFELLYLLEGRRTLVTRRGRHTAQAGDLIIFYPHESHKEVSPAGRLAFFVLRFPQPQLGSRLRFPEKRATPPVVRLPWPERFQQLFERMVVEKTCQDTWSAAMNDVLMIEFVVLLRRALQVRADQEPDVPSEKSRHIAQAIELIHAGLTGEFSLQDLARQTFMSQSSFSHTFKELTGIPPKHYYLQVKISKAKELLAATDRSVKDIAAELGYRDEHYFSRVFKKVAGVAPAWFRARCRKVHQFRKTVHSPPASFPLE